MRSIRGPARLVPLVAVAAGLRFGTNSSQEEQDALLDQDSYYWPSARGRVNEYGRSPNPGPTDLSTSLAWEWHHPTNRFHTFTVGTLIDDQRSIYLAAEDAIRKFNSNGDLLWKWTPPGTIPTIPCLYKGAVYGTTSTGHLYALSMLTGQELWTTRLALQNGPTGAVQALNGVIVLAADAEPPLYANQVVVGVNSTDGTRLWDFQPDAPVWNFVALFVGDNSKPSFVFQDIEGRAYRNVIATGELRWKNGGRNGSWTDGSAMYGNYMVYTVTLHGCCCGPCQEVEQTMSEKTQGTLSAFRILDGSLAWSRRVWRPPNVIPAVGSVTPGGRPVVVMPSGKQCGPLSPSDVFVYDAEDGSVVSKMSLGRNPHLGCAGDLEGMEYRRNNNLRLHCNPPPWGAPTIDRDGIIFLGNQDGNFYNIRANITVTPSAPGAMSVFSKINTGAAFTAPGSAHALGMVAVTSCDGLYVFNTAVTNAEMRRIPRPTTRWAAEQEEDVSPAAIFARKVGAKMGLDPEAWARRKQQIDDKEVAALKRKDRRQRMTGRIELTRPVQHVEDPVDGDAHKSNDDDTDTEEGDDAGLLEGF